MPQVLRMEHVMCQIRVLAQVDIKWQFQLIYSYL